MNHAPDAEYFPTFKKIGRRLLRPAKWIGKGFLVLLVLLLVAHSVATFVIGRRLEARLNAIKARGEPIAMAELGKPKVLDAENAAPIYAQAFKTLKESGGSMRPDEIDEFLKPQSREGDPKLWDETRKILARNQKALALVEQALARPKCRFPVNWEAGTATFFPHYAPLRRLSQLLAADAIVQAHDGRMDRAVHSIELSLGISNALANEPALVACLVRGAMIRITANALRDVLARGDISEVQARRLHDMLGSIDTGPGFVRAMQAERTFGIWVFDLFRKDYGRAMAGLASRDYDRPSSLGWKLLGYLWRPFFYADELYYLDYMDACVKTSRLTFREAKRWWAGAGYGPMFPEWAIVSGIVTPIFSRARIRVDAAMAESAGSQIVLALRAYRNRHGSYPRTLDELRARLGWEIPKDIFSGRDFVYRRQGNGFLLYSVGENLKDDGARPLIPPPQPGTDTARAQSEGYVYQDMQGRLVADIVWEFDH